jgi:4-amino-4-deoxy-L-arabinose transferase-like glycosyltransferase
VGLALLLRCLSVAILPSKPADDTAWYLQKGVEVMTNTTTPDGFFAFAPLYAMLIGTFRVLLDYDQTLLLIRLVQAVLGALTCGFAWRIAFHLTSDARMATIAGLGLALNPIFVIENNSPTTETLFLFLLFWALALYIVAPPGTLRALAATGALMGLATLTRTMLLLFPIGLALHLVLTCPWKRALRGMAIMLIVYAAVVSTWTVYTLVKFSRAVVGGGGLGDLLLVSVTGYKGGPYAVDEDYAKHNGGVVPTGSARTEVAVNTVASAVLGDPLGYLKTRLGQLGGALLQPHQTPYFPGQSLKALAAEWLAQDRSLAGLGRLVNGEAFWPKLALYVAHYLALLFGAIGIILSWRQWRAFAPLYGLIAYTLLLHFFLLATPRYLLPIMPALWVFASVAMVRVWDKVRRTQAPGRYPAVIPKPGQR